MANTKPQGKVVWLLWAERATDSDTVAKIADLCGSAEGTIKSHLNAIYRKSGTSGRGDLLSVIIDGLINTPGGDGGGRAMTSTTAK